MATMNPDVAAAYMTGHMDQVTAALTAGDTTTALGVVRSIRDDGHHEVADVVLDGIVAATRIGSGR